MMSEYDFTLKFRLPDSAGDPAQFIDALAEAGCDDATVGIGQRGRIALAFVREADTAVQAVASAVRAVVQAIPGAELIEAAPDFVGLTDVAELIGCTRQNIRKLMISNGETFPVAVHEGSQSLWHLSSILLWFSDSQKRPVDRCLMELSKVTMRLNVTKESRGLPYEKHARDIEALVAHG